MFAAQKMKRTPADMAGIDDRRRRTTTPVSVAVGPAIDFPEKSPAERGRGQVSEAHWCDLVVGESVKIGDTLVRLVKIRKGRSRLRIDVQPPAVEKQAAEIDSDERPEPRLNRG